MKTHTADTGVQVIADHEEGRFQALDLLGLGRHLGVLGEGWEERVKCMAGHAESVGVPPWEVVGDEKVELGREGHERRRRRGAEGRSHGVSISEKDTMATTEEYG